MPTQDERKADTRRRLLDAASELFARRGIDAVSVDAVAAAADRTSGAVYAHFGSKHGLLLALLDDWRTPLVGSVLSAIAHAPDLRSRLHAVAMALIVGPSPATVRLLQLEQELRLRASRDPAVAEVLAARAGEHRRWLTAGLARWQQAGWVPSGRPASELALVFSATVTGLAWEQLTHPGAVDAHAAVRALAAALGADPLPTGPPAADTVLADAVPVDAAPVDTVPVDTAAGRP